MGLKYGEWNCGGVSECEFCKRCPPIIVGDRSGSGGEE